MRLIVLIRRQRIDLIINSMIYAYFVCHKQFFRRLHSSIKNVCTYVLFRFCEFVFLIKSRYLERTQKLHTFRINVQVFFKLRAFQENLQQQKKLLKYIFFLFKDLPIGLKCEDQVSADFNFLQFLRLLFFVEYVGKYVFS